MDEKLELFEHLQQLIDMLEKNFHKRCSNYTQLADDLPLGRKDKQKIVDILEEFYPPMTKNVGGISRRRAPKNNIGLTQGIKLFNKQTLGSTNGSGFYDSEDLLLKKDEQFLDRICIKIPGLHQTKSEYQAKGGSGKFGPQFDSLNLAQMIIQNFQEADFQETFGEEVARIAQPSQGNLTGNIDFRYVFSQSTISIKNIRVAKHLLFHSIASFPFYHIIKSLNLTNTTLHEENLLLLLEYAKVFGKMIESIELVNINLSDQAVESVCQILAKRQVKKLSISKCGLKSKPFGKICLAILEGRTVESLDFSYNFIGKNFLF